MFDKFTYEVVKGGKKGEVMIKKSGLTHEFSLHEIDQEQERAEKMIREIEANCKIKKDVTDNIIQHYGKVIAKLSDEELHACSMYWDAYEYQQKGAKDLKTLRKAIKDFKAEKREITKQTSNE